MNGRGLFTDFALSENSKAKIIGMVASWEQKLRLVP